MCCTGRVSAGAPRRRSAQADDNWPADRSATAREKGSRLLEADACQYENPAAEGEGRESELSKLGKGFS